jgi:rhodanese-related sulfurtransferase
MTPILGDRMRMTFNELIKKHIPLIEEIFPWDLVDEMASDPELLLVDIRCPDEYRQLRIAGSIAVPRGILESACEYGYDETVPELVEARDRRLVVVCRSGNRSVLAAHTLQLLGFTRTASLKTGLKGWNDYDQPLIDEWGELLDADTAERLLNPLISLEKLGPTGR